MSSRTGGGRDEHNVGMDNMVPRWGRYSKGGLQNYRIRKKKRCINGHIDVMLSRNKRFMAVDMAVLIWTVVDVPELGKRRMRSMYDIR